MSLGPFRFSKFHIVEITNDGVELVSAATNASLATVAFDEVVIAA